MTRRAVLGAVVLSVFCLSPAEAQDYQFLLPETVPTTPSDPLFGPRDVFASPFGVSASSEANLIIPAALTGNDRIGPAMTPSAHRANSPLKGLLGNMNTSLLEPGKYNYGSFRRIVPGPAPATGLIYQLNVPAAVSVPALGLPRDGALPMSDTPTYTPQLYFGTP